jgi:hypothetical protein
MAEIIIEIVFKAVSSPTILEIGDILLYAVAISAPTAMFLALLTALLIEGPDIISSAGIIFLPVLCYIILYNALRYCNVNDMIAFVVSSFSLLLVLLLKLKATKFGQVVKASTYMITGMAISFLLERSYLNLFYFIAQGINADFNNTVLCEFLLLIPPRIFEISLIHFVFCSKLDFRRR